MPESLVELLGLRHFGVPRITKVRQALGVTNLDDLEAAARDGRLEQVPGFGKKSVEVLLVSIQGLRERRRTIPRYVAETTAATAVHSLRQMANLAQVEVAGAIIIMLLVGCILTLIGILEATARRTIKK